MSHMFEAHATEQNTQQEITAKWESDQNHVADQAADEGRLVQDAETDLHLMPSLSISTPWPGHKLLTFKRAMEINNKNNPKKFHHAGRTEMRQYDTRAGPRRTLSRKTATQTTWQATTNSSSISL